MNNIPKFLDIGIETRHINETFKEIATIYARLINQNKFKYHTFFSASFYKIKEEDQRDNETELFNILKITQNLTESDIDNIDNKHEINYQN